MKESRKPKLDKSGKSRTKAEKCGICFFVNGKAIFTLVRTNDQEFNEQMLEKTYLSHKR